MHGLRQHHQHCNKFRYRKHHLRGIPSTSWLGESTRGLQPGGEGDVHKEAVHLLSLQPASITNSGAFKPECNDLSQFSLSRLSENLIS